MMRLVKLSGVPTWLWFENGRVYTALWFWE